MVFLRLLILQEQCCYRNIKFGYIMNKIIEARFLAPDIKLFKIEASKIAQKRKAGQFIILRVHPDGERIPLTIADSNSKDGTITIIVQGVGKTTKQLNTLEAGEYIQDLVGPLGKPSDIENFGTAVSIGGGVGTAIAFPTAKALKEAGNHVTSKLQDLLNEGRKIDFVLAIGPIPMMSAVAEVTRPHGIKTVVSLNPIMVDGTGMCGGCRAIVDDKTVFVCVDGPEFDAHKVNFNILTKRNRMYLLQEKVSYEHYCKLERKIKEEVEV